MILVGVCIYVLSTVLEVVVKAYSHRVGYSILFCPRSLQWCVNVDSVAQCHSYAITTSLHVYICYVVFLDYLLLFAWILFDLEI